MSVDQACPPQQVNNKKNKAVNTVLTGATRPQRQFFSFSNASSVITVPDWIS